MVLSKMDESRGSQGHGILFQSSNEEVITVRFGRNGIETGVVRTILTKATECRNLADGTQILVEQSVGMFDGARRCKTSLWRDA